MRSVSAGLVAVLFVLSLGKPPRAAAQVRPGDDFFGYANAAWLAATPIPAGRDRWNARTEIDALTRRQLTELLDDARRAPAGSLAKKVADFRAAWLDRAAIESRGLAPLAPLLDSIDRVADRAALARVLGAGLPADVDPMNWGVYRSSHVLGLAVQQGNHGERTNVVYLVQGGLGLPDREGYLDPAPERQALRRDYLAYLEQLLAWSGRDQAGRRAAAVLALETALARTHATAAASADDHNADHLWRRADFDRAAPGLNWSGFFAAAGLGRAGAVVVWQPSAVTGLAALAGSESLDVWRDYLRVRALDGYAEVLPRAIAEPAAAFHAKAGGRTDTPTPDERALTATQAALSDAVGRLYVDRYFPPREQARVERIAANVIAALRRRVARAAWLSPAGRAVALAKLDVLYFGIGRPPRWQDDSGLVIDPTDPLGNLRRVAARDRRRTLGRLGRPVDRREWAIAAQTVGAILTFQLNAYNFPAALLQAPKYDPAASDAANYGAIGAIVGHEASHFVDLLGADYDVTGKNRRWWTPEEVTRYQTAAEPLVRQYAEYRPLPEVAVDGKRTLSENIADLAGLAAAFDAYRASLGTAATDTVTVRRQDRDFFLGFARSWRGHTRAEALPGLLATDSHAPERYRIATVRNLDAWYDAFDVRPGQALYLTPAARVRIW